MWAKHTGLKRETFQGGGGCGDEPSISGRRSGKSVAARFPGRDVTNVPVDARVVQHDPGLTTPHAKHPSKSWSVRLVQLVRARHRQTTLIPSVEQTTRGVFAKPNAINHLRPRVVNEIGRFGNCQPHANKHPPISLYITALFADIDYNSVVSTITCIENILHNRKTDSTYQTIGYCLILFFNVKKQHSKKWAQKLVYNSWICSQ